LIDKKLQKYLEDNIIKISITGIKPLSGGNISSAFFLETTAKNLVLKTTTSTEFSSLFKKEEEGLIVIEKSKTIKVPKVIKTGVFNSSNFILLEHIETEEATQNFWLKFGEQLASLHQNTAQQFGFNSPNYIGSLPQQNNYCTDVISFYSSQRLEPQFKIAALNGFTFKNKDRFIKELELLIPKEPPALIHGDLWNGNYLIGPNTTPYLIDPAISYCHREMDIAMMHLFGGFPSTLYTAYQYYFPLQEDWQKRLEIWQLYYLLVHLNIFGSSYYETTNTIIKKFT